MTTEWIRRGERVTVYEYRLGFEWDDTPGAGFGFPCDKDGNLLEEPTPDKSWYTNYIGCTSGEFAVHPIGVEEWESTYWEPGIIRCKCGEEVYLEMTMTNTCEKCHRDYNSFGQLLAPREQWGWDTGESLSDIMMANRPIDDTERDWFDRLSDD